MNMENTAIPREALWDVLRARHSVRRYTDRPVEPEKAAALQAEIDAIGRETGLDFRLVLDDPNVFRADRPRYGSFSGCRNFIVLYGPKGADEQVGYHGERLVLLAQSGNFVLEFTHYIVIVLCCSRCSLARLSWRFSVNLESLLQ